jgi:hypothetical protein
VKQDGAKAETTGGVVIVVAARVSTKILANKEEIFVE